MTPQQPQRLYGITKEELDDIGMVYACDITHKFPARKRCAIIEGIRSRPIATPAPSPICDRCRSGVEPFCIGCDGLSSHDAAIAAQARKEERERVLEKVKHIIEYNDDLFQYVGNHILKQKVVAYDFLLSDEGIESLRGDNK